MKGLKEYLMENVDDLHSIKSDKDKESDTKFVESQIKIYPLVLRWVRLYILPLKQKTYNHTTTSYGLKHKCENMIGRYVWNETMKYAMMEVGFIPKGSINHTYQLNNRGINILYKKASINHGIFTDFPELMKK